MYRKYITAHHSITRQLILKKVKWRADLNSWKDSYPRRRQNLQFDFARDISSHQKRKWLSANAELRIKSPCKRMENCHDEASDLEPRVYFSPYKMHRHLPWRQVLLITETHPCRSLSNLSFL